MGAAMSWRGWSAFLALGVIWGIPYFFIKLAVQELSPFVVAWSRIVLAMAVLLPIAWHRGALAAVRGHWGAVIAFAVVEFAVPFSAISLGERWISSSVTGILIATVPLIVTLTSRFFGLHERVGFGRLTGLVAGLIGVVILLGVGSVTGPLGWAGVTCMLVASVGYAVGPLIVQRHLAGMDSLGPVAASLLAASVILLWPACANLPGHMPTLRALACIAVLGLVCTAMAMLLMFYLIGHAGAARATVITYINPVVATALGTIVLHERLGLGGALAFGLILLGSWLATRKGAADAVPEPAR
jgi:drug/metabolite transporter (DMT)-like permease